MMPEGVDRELVEEIGRGLVPETENIATLDDVPGWFGTTDQDIFRWVLEDLAGVVPGGNVVELGTYLGKSAIHLGRFVRDPHELFVCDLFGMDPSPDAMSPCAREFYSWPFRSSFERHYLSFHRELPVVVQGPTSDILSHVAADSCGFVHVDASHEYEAVRTDLRSARRLLKPGGLVALDDYRAAHTPGTAAAVWEAVANDGLRPVCVSADKFYGMWGNARPLQDELVRLSREHGGYASAEHRIMGRRLIRVVRRQTSSANRQ